MLDLNACRQRQDRFRQRLEEAGLDAALISDARDIYYLTGVLFETFPALLFIRTDGGSWLASHDDGGTDAAVDERLAYEWHMLYTMNPDPMTRLNELVRQRAEAEADASRLGWQAESQPSMTLETIRAQLGDPDLVKIDGILEALQKRKDPDEVALLVKSIQVTLAAYDRAQRAINDGVSELAVLAEGTAGALLEAGEVAFHGGDYACRELGGPARDRTICTGDLYIIDGQSTYRGYWSDMSRTFVVGGRPTDLQQSVYDHLAAILNDVPSMVRPGGSASELWRGLDARIREHPYMKDTGLIHHGGHGVGVRPHEAPDLNRDRDGLFEIGDVFSCEPGAYGDDLGFGIRLENTFHITEEGVELLSDYPLNLIPISS